MFPIPMRGNEGAVFAVIPGIIEVFPIPMRGNEITFAVRCLRRSGVPDPGV